MVSVVVTEIMFSLHLYDLKVTYRLFSNDLSAIYSKESSRINFVVRKTTHK